MNNRRNIQERHPDLQMLRDLHAATIAILDEFFELESDESSTAADAAIPAADEHKESDGADKSVVSDEQEVDDDDAQLLESLVDEISWIKEKESEYVSDPQKARLGLLRVLVRANYAFLVVKQLEDEDTEEDTEKNTDIFKAFYRRKQQLDACIAEHEEVENVQGSILTPMRKMYDNLFALSCELGAIKSDGKVLKKLEAAIENFQIAIDSEEFLTSIPKQYKAYKRAFAVFRKALTASSDHGGLKNPESIQAFTLFLNEHEATLGALGIDLADLPPLLPVEEVEENKQIFADLADVVEGLLKRVEKQKDNDQHFLEDLDKLKKRIVRAQRHPQDVNDTARVFASASALLAYRSADYKKKSRIGKLLVRVNDNVSGLSKYASKELSFLLGVYETINQFYTDFSGSRSKDEIDPLLDVLMKIRFELDEPSAISRSKTSIDQLLTLVSEAVEIFNSTVPKETNLPEPPTLSNVPETEESDESEETEESEDSQEVLIKKSRERVNDFKLRLSVLRKEPVPASPALPPAVPALSSEAPVKSPQAVLQERADWVIAKIYLASQSRSEAAMYKLSKLKKYAESLVGQFTVPHHDLANAIAYATKKESVPITIKNALSLSDETSVIASSDERQKKLDVLKRITSDTPLLKSEIGIDTTKGDVDIRENKLTVNGVQVSSTQYSQSDATTTLLHYKRADVRMMTLDQLTKIAVANVLEFRALNPGSVIHLCGKMEPKLAQVMQAFCKHMGYICENEVEGTDLCDDAFVRDVARVLGEHQADIFVNLNCTPQQIAEMVAGEKNEQERARQMDAALAASPRANVHRQPVAPEPSSRLKKQAVVEEANLSLESKITQGSFEEDRWKWKRWQAEGAPTASPSPEPAPPTGGNSFTLHEPPKPAGKDPKKGR